ncbi:hypothetical protein [Agromyces albus]|uniref:Secreted protein n=1 Tax=Agromyces albus TaxID=205332 RepID=A0A4V1QYA3_9MICO|nr:hypothetical protein [Agromyces albus]RXZ72456.1 hypothetical protein ESP51_04660 [Agromyces albus]
MSALKLASVVAVVLLAGMGLAGCISPASGFAVLDRAAEAGDALPKDLPDYADDSLDPTTSRFVGEHDGDRLYLARGDNSAICLVIYPNNEEWVVGCGEGGGLTAVSGPSGTYEIRPDGAPAPTGAEEISPNVFTAG